jgi:hypothetical protein
LAQFLEGPLPLASVVVGRKFVEHRCAWALAARPWPPPCPPDNNSGPAHAGAAAAAAGAGAGQRESPPPPPPLVGCCPAVRGTSLRFERQAPGAAVTSAIRAQAGGGEGAGGAEGRGSSGDGDECLSWGRGGGGGGGVHGAGHDDAAVARHDGRTGIGITVRRAFPSWNRSMLTEIYLCHALTTKLRMETPGQASGGTAQPCEPSRHGHITCSLT